MTMLNKTILFVGPIKQGSTTRQKLNGLKKIVKTVFFINTIGDFDYRDKFTQRVLSFFYRKTGVQLPFAFSDPLRINQTIISKVLKENVDILWIDKGLNIKPSTLIKLKKNCASLKIIGYSPDDMLQRHNNSTFFLSCLPYYDMFYTTKTYNVKELKKLGANHVEFIKNTYQEEIHFPVSLTQEDMMFYSSDVSFIGDFESDRFEVMKFLADKGITITIWGPNWSEVSYKNLVIKNKTLKDIEYSKAIVASKICLGFLKKSNRDLQTTRTIEVPACGGFLLAEDTIEHRALFEPDSEMVFFKNNYELLDKITFYLKNDEERIRISKSAFERCINSNYENKKVLFGAVQKLNDI